MNTEELLKRFCDRMAARRVRLHGAVLISGGEVVGETYLGSYTRDTLTRMYSTSKSVAAVAIGKLVGEGRISLDDRITDLFSNRFDMSEAHPLLRELTVRNMLKMTTVYSKPTYNAGIKDWLASYFRATPDHAQDTVWGYDSCGSYVLGALVKHITGLDFVEYLRPEFDIMGVSRGVYAIKGPDGEAWASSGFMATTADLGKIAYLLLNGGRWGDAQLIPEDYTRDAISPLERNDDKDTSSPYDCGYGYQIWSHPGGAFAFRGLGGQIAIGYPARDLVFSCNSDTSCNYHAYGDIFDAVADIIAPAFPEINPAARLSYPPVTETVLREVSGKTYTFDDNQIGISSLSLSGEGENMCLTYVKGGVECVLPITAGRENRIVFPEKYSGEVLFDEERYMNYVSSVSAEWLSKRKLYIRVFAEDIYVGNMSLSIAFRDDGIVSVKADQHAQFFFDGYAGTAWGRCSE